MRIVTSLRPSKALDRAKDIWSELDQAQTRLLEIQTGVPLSAFGERRRQRLAAHELERASELDRAA